MKHSVQPKNISVYGGTNPPYYSACAYLEDPICILPRWEMMSLRHGLNFFSLNH